MNTSWPLIMVHEHAGWWSICLCVIVYGCVFQSMCVIPVICIYIYISGSCVPHFKVLLHPLRCGQISSSLLIIMIFYPQICTCDRAMWSCCEHVTSLFVLFSKLSAFLEYIVTLLLLTFILLFTFFVWTSADKSTYMPTNLHARCGNENLTIEVLGWRSASDVERVFCIISPWVLGLWFTFTALSLISLLPSFVMFADDR